MRVVLRDSVGGEWCDATFCVRSVEVPNRGNAVERWVADLQVVYLARPLHPTLLGSQPCLYSSAFRTGATPDADGYLVTNTVVDAVKKLNQTISFPIHHQ